MSSPQVHYLTVGEVASRARRSDKAIYLAIEEGRLKCVIAPGRRVGRIMIAEDECDRFCRGLCSRGEAVAAYWRKYRALRDAMAAV